MLGLGADRRIKLEFMPCDMLSLHQRPLHVLCYMYKCPAAGHVSAANRCAETDIVRTTNYFSKTDFALIWYIVYLMF